MSRVNDSPTNIAQTPYIPQKNLLRPFSGRIFSKVLAKTEQPDLSFFKKAAISLNLVWCTLFIPLDMAWNILLIPITFVCIPLKYTFKWQAMPGIKDWFLEIKMVFVCVAEIGILPISGFSPRNYAVMHHALVGYRTFNVRFQQNPKDKDFDLELEKLDDSELEKLKIAKSEPKKPKVAKAEPKKPEVAKPEPKKPEIARPEPKKPGVARPEPSDLKLVKSKLKVPSAEKAAKPKVNIPKKTDSAAETVEVNVLNLMRTHLNRNPGMRESLECDVLDFSKAEVDPFEDLNVEAPKFERQLSRSLTKFPKRAQSSNSKASNSQVRAQVELLNKQSTQVPAKVVSTSVKVVPAKVVPTSTKASPTKAVPTQPKAARTKVVPTLTKASPTKAAPTPPKAAPTKVVPTPPKAPPAKQVPITVEGGEALISLFEQKLASIGMLNKFESTVDNEIDGDSEWNEA